jgi:hypothetical protein
MTEFAPGDRVRVLDRPGTFPFTGRSGEVVARVRCRPERRVLAYQVLLDQDGEDIDGSRYVAFRPDELEPE